MNRTPQHVDQDEDGAPGRASGVAAPGDPPDPRGAVAEVLELGGRAVSAHRVSLWIMEAGGDGSDDEGDPGRVLRRVHLHHPATGAHTAGGLLPEARYPGYFRALDADDLLVVDDLLSDPRTAELLEPYALPLGLQGWIDQQVRLPDGRRAVVRFERGGTPRRWSAREVRLARAVAFGLVGASDPHGIPRPAHDRDADAMVRAPKPPPADVGGEAGVSSGTDDEEASETGEAEAGGESDADETDAAYDADREYWRLLEHGRVGTLRLGPDGTIRHCNAGFLSLVEATDPDAVTGRPLGDFLDDEGTGPRLVSRLRDLDSLPLEELRLVTERGGTTWTLVTAVRTSRGDGHLVLLLDLTPQKEREMELERQAHFDALTGLPNRRLLWQQATRLLALADRQGRSAAVAYLDLSGFKAINDRYGHVAGDRILEAVGRRLEEGLRESDVGARIGGDEFAVLLSEVDGAEGGREAGRRILDAVVRPVTVGQEEIPVEARVGVALYPDHGDSLDDLLDRADQAMYVAYGADEDDVPVEVFSPSESPPSPRPDKTTRDLQRAVDNDEFILHYQPIVGLPRGEFSGVEALIRWRHPQHGLLEPAAFLSDALQAGLLVEIDRWVLRRAIRQAAHWERRGGPDWVSVNLSLPSLRDPALPPFLAEELHGTELGPGRLMLEVSEPDVREAGQAALATLSSARDLGIRLAADCRETGPEVRSSLAELDVDIVKVELDMVRDLPAPEGEADDDHEAWNGLLAELLVDPDVPLLAEGIETEGEFAWARGSVFTMAQGYYMSRPAPASEIRFGGGDGVPAANGEGDGNPGHDRPEGSADGTVDPAGAGGDGPSPGDPSAGEDDEAGNDEAGSDEAGSGDAGDDRGGNPHPASRVSPAAAGGDPETR